MNTQYNDGRYEPTHKIQLLYRTIHILFNNYRFSIILDAVFGVKNTTALIYIDKRLITLVDR